MLAHRHRAARVADATLATRRLPRIYADYELEVVRTSYALARQADDTHRSTLARFTFVPVRVWSSPADHFPQTALVQSRLRGRQYPKARVLHQLVRLTDDAPWLVALTLYPDHNPLARTPTVTDGTAAALPGTTVVDGLRLRSVNALVVEALDRPTSSAARRFRGNPRRGHFSDVERHLRKWGVKRLDFSAHPGGFWLRTTDGGAIGLVPLTFVDVVTAPEDKPFALRLSKHQEFDGPYHQAAQEGLVTCLVVVPATGRISLPHCDWSWGKATMT